MPPSGRLVEAEELVLAPGCHYREPCRLQPVRRRIGQNDCGMVASVMTLRTPEVPQVRGRV